MPSIDELLRDVLGEERPIHPDFDLANANDRAHDVDVGLDERERIVRVVNVARSMKQVEKLPGLCDRAEQRIELRAPLRCD